MQASRLPEHFKNIRGLFYATSSESISGQMAIAAGLVPKGMSDYKKQAILDESTTQGILSDISKIAGIGPAGTRELNAINIRTVQDLKNAIENSKDPKLFRFKPKLESFLK